jgi:hypothetical protein
MICHHLTGPGMETILPRRVIDSSGTLSYT